MDDNKLEAKLLKIKALAERGEGGEKEAAIKMYHKLLKKYDIDEKALQKDKLSKHWFTYETDIEENLLVQIFYMVTRIFPPDKPYTRSPVRMHMYRF